VLAFANVMDFLADELTGLRRRGFARALVPAGALERGLFRHDFLPTCVLTQPRCHQRLMFDSHTSAANVLYMCRNGRA
jgi:hypothetical protein